MAGKVSNLLGTFGAGIFVSDFRTYGGYYAVVVGIPPLVSAGAGSAYITSQGRSKPLPEKCQSGGARRIAGTAFGPVLPKPPISQPPDVDVEGRKR
jgi:hypothetical protein